MKSYIKIKILLFSLLISSFSFVNAHHHATKENKLEKHSEQEQASKGSVTKKNNEIKEKHKVLKIKMEKNS